VERRWAAIRPAGHCAAAYTDRRTW